MDAHRLSSYRQVKELTARVGPAKLTDVEAQQIVDAAEALMLDADDATLLRNGAERLIAKLLADRPSWKGAEATAAELRTAIGGCGEELIAA